MVYVIQEIDIDDKLYYRIGKTDNMNKRINIYNKKVVHYVELLCPLQLETCVRSMLYKYIYKNRKDYFQCNLNKIIKAFDKCVENQHGGDNKLYTITYYNDTLTKIHNIINVSTIL